jgi:antitoxin component YwqK of YwqJK toxin-antitoxin module
MKTELEKNLKTYYDNGNLQYEYKWNADGTTAYLIREYYDNGNLKQDCELNADGIKLMRIYYDNGNLQYEWKLDTDNADGTETIIKKR